MFDYHQASIALFQQIVDTNKKTIPKAVEWMSKNHH